MTEAQYFGTIPTFLSKGTGKILGEIFSEQFDALQLKHVNVVVGNWYNENLDTIHARTTS